MFELFRHRRLVVPIALLYLSQGIPIGIAMDAMPTLLRHGGAQLQALAFLPLVGLPWVIKFLWAPIVDNYGFSRLGHRRTWIIPMQGLVLLCLLLMAGIGIAVDTAVWAVALMVVASLSSATQDIATDGMAAEYTRGTLLAKINAIQTAGVMVGFFIGGAGMLTLTGYFGQRMAFLLLACVPLLSIACVLGWLPATEVALLRTPRNASLVRFLRRPGALPLLCLSLLSAMTAVSGFGLSKLFLNDAGWSLQDIGQLGMVSGLITVVLGCGGGAWLIQRIGLWPAFCLGVGCASVSAFMWVSLVVGDMLQMEWAWGIAALGALSTGFTSVAIMTAGMHFASQGTQAGTDVTAVQSTRDLGELLASSMLVTLTANLGYAGSFSVGGVIAIVALLLALQLGAREDIGDFRTLGRH